MGGKEEDELEITACRTPNDKLDCSSNLTVHPPKTISVNANWRTQGRATNTHRRLRATYPVPCSGKARTKESSERKEDQCLMHKRVRSATAAMV